MKIPESLTNHFLIATPALQDTFFEKSVIYLFEHDSKGAMGVIINKSLQVTLKSLLEHLNIDVIDDSAENISVLSGGPVSPEQGFVLLDPEEEGDDKDIIISSSKETLKEISEGKGPKSFIVVLGYAGWEKGQLEDEISRNDWLVAPFNSDILFTTSLENRWQKAAAIIGIDINKLSTQSGHA